MSSEVTFHLATSKDLQALIRVGKELFDHSIKLDRAVEFLDDARHHMILAYANEKVVGMASGFKYVHPDKDAALFISEVGVVDEYQNRGIGRELVKRLCKHGKTLGCGEAWVATEQSNQAARRTYIAAGGIEDDEPIVLFDFKLD